MSLEPGAWTLDPGAWSLEPRTNACAPVCGFLPTLDNGVATFNNLTLLQQIAATLITEEDQQSHHRLDHFLQALAPFQEMALVNSAHHAENSHISFNELKLEYIMDFLKMREATGHHERVGALPATN